MLRFDRVRLVRDDFEMAADFEVPSGVTAVIGPSGAGKSTLLDAVAGFLEPRAGQVQWEGRDLGPLGPGARPVSILFQENNLFPHLDIARNVGFGLSPSGRLTAAQAETRDAVLGQVGLRDLSARRPGQLSGGQQSRAALARVLVSDRPIVLLDEPFSALGPGLRAEMLSLVRRLLGGRTVLMVTHDPAEARSHADRVIFVDGGRAAAPVSVGPFFDDPPPAVRRYLGT